MNDCQLCGEPVAYGDDSRIEAEGFWWHRNCLRTHDDMEGIETMDTFEAAIVLGAAFGEMDEDGEFEAEVRCENGGSAIVDGGNWSLLVCGNGMVWLDMPSRDPDYYSANPETFVQNVISMDALDALTIANYDLGMALSAGLRKTRGKCGVVLARLMEESL